VKLREVTVDDRVSWRFSLAVVLAGIAVAWWINLVAGVALLLPGCAGMLAVRVPFGRRQDHVRKDRAALPRTSKSHRVD
jgi:hypothetical protein